MTIGTKSILYGAHAFWLHPWFVAWGWTKLYGFPWDPRLWVVFIIHDLGYWGKPNMDGKEGEDHPRWGANLADRWFTKPDESSWIDGKSWYWFVWCHSRYCARKVGILPSRLCFADKLAFGLTPSWIYIPMVWLTGEWQEYATAHAHECGISTTLMEWYWAARIYTADWVVEHCTGKVDTWTRTKPTLTE